VRRHPRLDANELAHEYAEAWRAFYTWRRLAWSLATWHRVSGLGPAARSGMVTHTAYYTYSLRRGWHPMLGGVWRRRRLVRRDASGDREALQFHPTVAASGADPGDISR
jgi:hypothetical protein